MSAPAKTSSATLAAFEQLKATVASLNEEGKVPTAAWVKSTMLAEDPSFSERTIGYKRFIDFIEAAVEARYVSMLRDPQNHPRLFPVGIPDADIRVVISEPAPIASGEYKLRSDVWRSFVDWHSGYLRAWDRRLSRAFMYPAGSDQPAWVREPTRFVEIRPISREQQLFWMKEFSEAQPEVERSELVTSLGANTPAGEFKRALEKFGLATAWNRELQAHAGRLVQEWAAENRVSVSHLFDTRSSRQVHTDQPVVAKDSSASSRVDEADSLRQRLHMVIDAMPLSELAALQIPAGYLITD